MKLSDLRKSAGYETQAELAKEMEVSQAAVSWWESGTLTPSDENTLKLSKLLNVEPHEIRGEDINTDNIVPIRTKQRRAMHYVVRKINELSAIAMTDEDFDSLSRLEDLKELLSFKTIGTFYKCPACGSSRISRCNIGPCCFEGLQDKSDGKIEMLQITKCEDCGLYTLC